MANELDPRTRKEVFLAGMLYGDPDDLPDPNTRDELFMKAIAETIKEGGVPSPEGANVGDVLTIGADGPEWTAPSGGTLYRHNIRFTQTNMDVMTVIINSTSTALTKTDVLAHINALTDGGYIAATGMGASMGKIANLSYITKSYADTMIRAKGPAFVFADGTMSGELTFDFDPSAATITMTDSVVEIV